MPAMQAQNAASSVTANSIGGNDDVRHRVALTGDERCYQDASGRKAEHYFRSRFPIKRESSLAASRCAILEPEFAPIAIRIPNSRVRRLTEYATSPYNPTMASSSPIIPRDTHSLHDHVRVSTHRFWKKSSIVRTP